MYNKMLFWILILSVDFWTEAANLNELSKALSFQDYFQTVDSNDNLQPLRKCCNYNQFYSIVSQKCENGTASEVFEEHIRHKVLGTNRTLYPFQKRIAPCPNTFEPPDNVLISGNDTHFLYPNGTVLDLSTNNLFTIAHYCFEVVGSDIENVDLVLAFCLEKENFIPKCCPSNYYFDSRISDCYEYYSVNESEGDVGLFPYLRQEHELFYYQELLCEDPPANIYLDETYFSRNTLCIENVKECYSRDNYCIENMLDPSEGVLVPMAFVCPDYFFNKCCPDGESLYENGCMESRRQSLSMIHMTRNNRYQIKTASSTENCTPLTIEDGTRSDISWEIDSFAMAVVRKSNKTVRTKNYCIDDFVTDNDIFPVIKVCSEEIEEYHEVSSINDWTEEVGKCCPLGMVYHPNTTSTNNASCIDEDSITAEFVNNAETLILPKLVYTSFPKCPSGADSYHPYQLLDKTRDYAKLIENRDLKVVVKENDCRGKETILKAANFCMEFMVFGDDLIPVAIICSPDANGPHFERNPIIVSLISVSCLALLTTLVSLVCTRVRRGMVTVKKVNTLAGRILISYVVTQLLSFIGLSVGALADFKEDIYKCFILGGFILYFSVSSFCWNTSICLEGLLLTLHVKTSEKCRFILHCIWGWGSPCILTAAALIKDIQREQLGCDAITPKFGVERCFFSDRVAQILYFFLPISVTVLLNIAFLVVAKFLRKTKLKNLEKDPNRIRRHGTLKQVFSITNRKSFNELKKQREEQSTHSGLRTHQFQKTWLESTKLVLWSGGTWIMEILAVVINMYFGFSQGEWYQYLWYIPVGFNCLRGVGIFVIIVVTAENKDRLIRTVRNLGSTVNGNVSKFISVTHHRKSTVRDKVRHSRQNPLRVPKKEERKESVSTIFTYLSSVNQERNGTSPFCHSVSYEEVRRGSFSSGLSDVFEVTEHDAEKNADKNIWKISPELMDYCTHL